MRILAPRSVPATPRAAAARRDAAVVPRAPAPKPWRNQADTRYASPAAKTASAIQRATVCRICPSLGEGSGRLHARSHHRDTVPKQLRAAGGFTVDAVAVCWSASGAAIGSRLIRFCVLTDGAKGRLPEWLLARVIVARARQRAAPRRGRALGALRERAAECRRALSNEFKRNPQWYKPFIVYLPVLVLGQGAWLLVGARMVGRERLLSPRALYARVRLGDQASLLLLWLVLPLAVFWLSSSRLPLYVLPLYAPIALALARTVARGRAVPAPRAFAVASLSAALIVILKAASAYAAPATEKDMGRLFAAAQREAGPEAEYRVFGGTGSTACSST